MPPGEGRTVAAPQGADELLGVGEGDVGAEADHADAGGNTLATAEGGAGFEFAFERNSEGDDEEVGGSVEGDGDGAENGELEKDVAVLGSNELRDEREKEECGFGIEDFGEDALTKGVARRGKRTSGKLGVARADHANAKKNEIGGAGKLDRVKGQGGSGKNSGNTGSGGKNVDEAAEESATRGEQAFATATGKAAGEDIEDAWARSEREDQGGGEEEEEMMDVKHEDSLHHQRD